MKKKQKTFSLPQAVDEELETFLEANKTMLEKLGVTNKTQLLVAIYRNGKPRYENILAKVKETEEN